MELIRAIAALFAIAFGIWGLPGVWEHWSRERRIAARIERQGKVLDRIEDERVRQIIERDNAKASVELVSILRVSVPKVIAVNAAISFLMYLALPFVVAYLDRDSDYDPRLLAMTDRWWNPLIYVVLLYFALAFSAIVIARFFVGRDRKRFIRAGLPDKFRPRVVGYTDVARLYFFPWINVYRQIRMVRLVRKIRRERRLRDAASERANT